MPKNSNATKTDLDDEALFRAAMQDVSPLPACNKAVIQQRKPEPKPRRIDQLLDENNESSTVQPDLEANGDWAFLRPGVSRQTLRRLRNKYWAVQNRLDLHGLTQDAARQQLALFLNQAIQNNHRCVLIIHGKGLSSVDGVPVLKQRIGGWLAQCDAVLAFCQARAEDGGNGAVVVLLKK